MVRHILLACAVATLALVSQRECHAQRGGPVLAPSVAARAGLERQWFAQASVDGTRTQLQAATLQGDRLFLTTTENVVESIDAETGRRMWAQRVGRAFSGLVKPAASNVGVATVAGSDVYLLDRANGDIRWQTRTNSVALAGPAINDEWVYVGLINGNLRAFPMGNPELVGGAAVQPWFNGSSGQLNFSPILTRELIIWGNSNGLIYASAQDQRQIAFQFEMGGKLTAPLAFWPPYLYAVDDNNVLSAIQAEYVRSGGELAWEYNIGGPVTQRPIPLGEHVYVVRDNFGLICLQATTPPPAPAGEEDKPQPRVGSPVWIVPGIAQFAAATENRVYGLDREGRLVIMDRAKGTVLGSLPTMATPRALANDINDRIYLMSSAGTIICLREEELKRPVTHAWPSLDREPGAIQIGGQNPPE
jgi:outer membrane protein assembly factor BamB